MENNDKIKKLETSYDEVPYISKTFFNTQPIRLKTILKLLDYDAPNIETAKVLEIGCSFGGNIIPFALSYPNSKVTGIDLSETQINEGKKIIKHLEIDNIELLHQNVLEYETDEIFDYIICHGVYSWIPEEVQKGILKLVKKNLAKNGLALISYNTYPGWKNLEVLRDVMLFRDKYLTSRGVKITSENKVSFGRGALEFLKDYSHLNSRIKSGIDAMTDKNDYYILHEYYELFNKPLYLHEFNEYLEKNGLKHIIDSDFSKSFPMLNDELEDKINNECGDDYITREQYFDFLFDTQFRSSIITHKENIKNITISKHIKISNLSNLHYRGAFSKNENGLYTTDDETNVSNDRSQILEFITNVYPSTTTVDEIIENFKEKIDSQTIYHIIINLIYSKSIETFDKALTLKTQKKLNILPRYKKYLEYFAYTEHPIINFSSRNGLNIQIGDLQTKMQTIIQSFNGNQTDEDIVKTLLQKEKNGEIIVTIPENETLENVIKDYVKGLRNLIENNFFHMEI